VIHADTSDLNVLAVDLAQAGLAAAGRAMVVVEDSSQRIEDQGREWAPKTGLPHYARTITHDVTVEGLAIVGEIGPDPAVNGQALLAHILEYGSANNAPFAHLGPALDRETPNFVDTMAEAGDRL
jgi:hypothetical protein